MRTRSVLSRLLAMSLLGAAFATGCQTYDFEPVAPIALTSTTIEVTLAARTNPPNLMILVDTSGSMLEPMDPSHAACRSPHGGICLGANCPAECPTRWRALQGAMGSFLSSHGHVARFGLATYPGPQLVLGERCGATQQLTLDLPTSDNADVLQAHALAVNEELQRISESGADRPTGGTPTSSSLHFLGALPQLRTDTRADFVLLLTDGLPNCNEHNPSSGSMPQCRCTVGPGACSGSIERLGCLDQDGSVAAVQELLAQDIQTIVIGFGAETASGDGPVVLNAMAEAGGFPRKCQQGAGCGPGDSCEAATGFCQRRYYQASNQEELAATLLQISSLVKSDPCLLEVPLGQLPEDVGMLVLFVNGERTPPGANTWRLKPGVGLEMLGDLCRRAERSTPSNPVKIEVRAVNPR
jgi:hypothetical protein